MPRGSYGRVGGGSSITGVPSDSPITDIIKSVGYVASGTNSNQIISIAADSASSVTTIVPRAIRVTNIGIVPTIVLSEYEGYSDEDTDAGRHTIQTMLMPGETFEPPARGIIPTANQLQVVDGTVVDFTTTIGDGSSTLSTLKSDSGDNVASGELANTTDPVVFELDNGHEKYRVGDYIRCENEILRVEGTYDDNPTTSAVADNHIVVSRGHLGSTTASHSGTPDIHFHCFNELYDYDRALLGSSQLNQTDGSGNYKLSSFFGYGRVDATADNKTFGIVPGSVLFRFYSSAYMDIPMGGTGVAGGTGGSNIHITSSTPSKLTASTEYSFNLTIDDSSATTVSFTTDSSNLNFGGVSGVVSLINDAILTATRTAGNNLYGYSCTVSITNGKLRFTSNSHLSPHDGTNGSKILLEDGAGGTNVLTGAAGIFPDINNSIAPVKPIISPASVYDSLTYEKSANVGAFCRDDGFGRLTGMGSGTINYETGAFRLSNCPINAEFEISLAHGSPFAGKLDATKEDTSVITAVHANVINQHIEGKLSVKVF
tara:strand:+ start:1187 stop:2815 length:1629 start_codon:yes stop_codon:yes gene_type:complete